MSLFAFLALLSAIVIVAWLVLAARIRGSLLGRYGGLEAEGDHGRAENGRRLRMWWSDPKAAGERRLFVGLTVLLVLTEIALTVALALSL